MKALCYVPKICAALRSPLSVDRLSHQGKAHKEVVLHTRQ